MTQPDLFVPCLAQHSARQGELFPERTSETRHLCGRCEQYMVETESGYITCPRGCGKLNRPTIFPLREDCRECGAEAQPLTPEGK